MQEATLESYWLHKGRVVLKFTDVHSITDAEKLRSFDVVIAREERMPLAGDAVYVSDLLGVRVIDVGRGGAQEAGEITDVEPEGAGPAMLVVRTQTRRRTPHSLCPGLSQKDRYRSQTVGDGVARGVAGHAGSYDGAGAAGRIPAGGN